MKRLRDIYRRDDGVAMATVVLMIAMLILLGVILIDQVVAESKRAARSVTSDATYHAAEAGINDYIAKLTEDPQYYDHCVAKGESTRRRSDNGVLVYHSSTTDSCQPGGSSAWTSGVRWSYPSGPSGKDWWFGGTGLSGDSTVLRGYAYNLQITPPAKSLGINYISVISTGCKVIDPDAIPLVCDPAAPKRAIETHVRRTTPADFQFMMTDMSSSNVCWASKIYGKMYSTGSIKVCGATAYGNMMAEQYVTGSGLTMVSPARIYDRNHPDIRTVVKDPIPFSSFSVSAADIKRAASLNTSLRPQGTVFDDASASSWRIVFSSDGNFKVWRCISPTGTAASDPPYCNDIKLSANVTLKSSSSATVYVNESNAAFPSSGSFYVGASTGSMVRVNYTGKGSNGLSFTGCTCSSCGTTGQTHYTNETVSWVSGGLPAPVPTYSGPIPSNGAVYTGQDAVISWISGITGSTSDGSSTLNGMATVASGNDMIIAGNLHYSSESGGADNDVLGLIAQSDFWLAKYAPDQLWFRGATMALTGLWGDYRCSKGGGYRGDSSSITFVGTSAYYSNDGCIRSSTNGGYNIDHTYRITDDGTAPECPSTAPGCQNFDALKFLFPPWFPVINGMETTVLFREVPPNTAADVVTG